MQTLWPEARWDPFPSAGPMTGGAPKALLHTTQGRSYAGARSVYAAKGYEPQFTFTYEHGLFEPYQHMPINQAGKALEHPSGTGATNTDNVVQVELVGVEPGDYPLPEEFLAGIARWLRWWSAQTGGRLTAPFPFGRDGTVRRPSWAEWHATSGIVGHCHAPANSHYDPGPFQISRLLQILGTAPQPGGAMPDNIVRTVKRRAGGRWRLGSDGGVFAIEGAPYFGGMGGQHLNAPMVTLVESADENGYWLIGADGGVFGYGDAPAHAPYQKFFDEYAQGMHHIVDAYLDTDGHLVLVSNKGEDYGL